MFSAVSVERYIGIFKPLNYEQVMTDKRAWMTIILVWVFGVAVGIITITGDMSISPGVMCFAHVVLNPERLQFLVCMKSILLITVTIINSRIMKAIRHQQRSIAPETQESATLKENLHIAKTFLMVVGVYVVCYIPFVLLQVIALHVPPGSVKGSMIMILGIPTMVNSVANPIIYALRMTSFRTAMRQTMFGCQANAVAPAPMN